MVEEEVEVAIIGGGIAGLTLALALQDVGVECCVFEAAPKLAPIGVGINILPHASAVLCDLGFESELSQDAITTRESAFFNRFGQLIYKEPAGRYAGYHWPQFSIHRGDLQSRLATAVVRRIGEHGLVTDRRFVDAGVLRDRVALTFESAGGQQFRVNARGVVGCDGVHSRVRSILFPESGTARYSGVHMWRGVATGPPFLSGATMVRAGWFPTGKMVIYPIRNDVDGRGSQLINWVAEVEQHRFQERDWNRVGKVEDFIDRFAEWRFDWLDVPALIESSEVVLEYPMVDQDPLARWTSGRMTLAGDAAHAMVPRGSNGAGQAILDARCLADTIRRIGDLPEAFSAYEAVRRPATTAVVEMSRTDPPDALLREVYYRTEDRPFDEIESVMTATEMGKVIERYRSVAGFVPPSVEGDAGVGGG